MESDRKNRPVSIPSLGAPPHTTSTPLCPDIPKCREGNQGLREHAMTHWHSSDFIHYSYVSRRADTGSVVRAIRYHPRLACTSRQQSKCGVLHVILGTQIRLLHVAQIEWLLFRGCFSLNAPKPRRCYTDIVVGPSSVGNTPAGR